MKSIQKLEKLEPCLTLFILRKESMSGKSRKGKFERTVSAIILLGKKTLLLI